MASQAQPDGAQSRRVSAAESSNLSGHRTAPDEVLAPSYDDDYIAYRSITDWREPYRYYALKSLNSNKSMLTQLKKQNTFIHFCSSNAFIQNSTCVPRRNQTVRSSIYSRYSSHRIHQRQERWQSRTQLGCHSLSRPGPKPSGMCPP